MSTTVSKILIYLLIQWYLLKILIYYAVLFKTVIIDPKVNTDLSLTQDLSFSVS